MNADTTSQSQPRPRPNHDGRVFGKDGEPDYFLVGYFGPKLGFFIFSICMFSVGLWDVGGPLIRMLWGETKEARVVRVVRESPGEEPEIIRIRREIKEGDYPYDTIFRHFVEVLDSNSNPQVMEMAVASRQTPYALVNETFKVTYFEGDEFAYGIYHHRTWAFGTALLLMGGTFIPLSWFLLSMVGKKVYIDPEDPEQIALEEAAQAREQEWSQGGDSAGSATDRPS